MSSRSVASLAEAWIEISRKLSGIKDRVVASLAEAWIEIRMSPALLHRLHQSPPSRRRGLKYTSCGHMVILALVASLAEAWIEISRLPARSRPSNVASLAEAWIEIATIPLTNTAMVVASLAEAWIEMTGYKPLHWTPG